MASRCDRFQAFYDSGTSTGTIFFDDGSFIIMDNHPCTDFTQECPDLICGRNGNAEISHKMFFFSNVE